ncbi:AraC family transcriptional regulator [Providencia sp. PROV225]|uniref:AraC family transcriptional regulator n=1 Tax=Providencia sp. PROV225 TaxID=2949918 RepID=UPI002348F07F|nr:AraC family transcriptional regulator [Providencia sp. PROV225]
MLKKDIAALLKHGDLCFSLQDKLILAVPSEGAATFCYKSPYSNLNIQFEKNAIFIANDAVLSTNNNPNWDIYSIELSELVEILAVIDTATKQSFLSKKAKCGSSNEIVQEYIPLDEEFFTTISVKNVVIDLVIREQPEFEFWCNILRKYEAYGMMRFILSAAQSDKNANINQLCARYGVSASYFRQLYRENFNKTAKRKIMSVRMANAILQLIESESSILDVGLEAGYCSVSHFTNDLKKELGLTPSEIRHLGDNLYEQ